VNAGSQGASHLPRHDASHADDRSRYACMSSAIACRSRDYTDFDFGCETNIEGAETETAVLKSTL
jgi:hypothetical protein